GPLAGLPRAPARARRRREATGARGDRARLVREVARSLAEVLAPSATLLALAVVTDLAIGDPVYAAHPIRVIGRSLEAIEAALFRIGANGYVGGIALFVVLAVVWITGLSLVVIGAWQVSPWLGWLVHLFVLYSLIALGDLLHHGREIERALRNHDLA